MREGGEEVEEPASRRQGILSPIFKENTARRAPSAEHMLGAWPRRAKLHECGDLGGFGEPYRARSAPGGLPGAVKRGWEGWGTVLLVLEKLALPKSLLPKARPVAQGDSCLLRCHLEPAKPTPTPSQPAQDLLCAGNRHGPITHEVGIPPHVSCKGSRGREGCGWLPSHVRKNQEDTEGMSTAQPRSSGPFPQPQQTNLQSCWSTWSSPPPPPALPQLRDGLLQHARCSARSEAVPSLLCQGEKKPSPGRARAGSTAPSAALRQAQRLQNRSLGHRGSRTLLLGETSSSGLKGGTHHLVGSAGSG